MQGFYPDPWQLNVRIDTYSIIDKTVLIFSIAIIVVINLASMIYEIVSYASKRIQGRIAKIKDIYYCMEKEKKMIKTVFNRKKQQVLQDKQYDFV